MTRWIAAAAMGCALLAYLVPRVHPARQWNISCDREHAQARAREISAALGVDTAGWEATVTGATDSKAGYAHAAGFSPVYPKVALKAPSGTGRITVGLSGAGEINRWEWKGYPSSGASDAATSWQAAQNALQHMAGAGASQFHAQPSQGDTIVFEKPGTIPVRFEGTVNGTRLVKAELRPDYPREVERGLSSRKKYINWLTGAAGILLDGGGTVIAISVYVFWAVRRAVKHRFVLALSGTSILWGAVYWSNWMGYDGRYDAVSGGDSFVQNFFTGVMILVALMVFYIVLAGATDAIGIRAKLRTLRSVFSPLAFNRQAGFSILAGFLCAPLLTALPLLVSTLRLAGSQQTGDYDASLMFSAHPAAQALDVILPPALLGLFGFGTGFLGRYVRNARVAAVLLAVFGAVLLATITQPSETSPFVFLSGAALVYGGYYYLFLKMDLLAVLSAGWCATAIWNASAQVLQPAASIRSSGIVALATLGAAAGCAALVAWRGRELELEEGAAPAAVTSQREALMNEFSIAHRVQQQMLPANPPAIAGCTLAASCHPAQEVGGDLFDFLQLPDGRWTIGVGDVSGKGVHAALYMTLTKGLLVATTQDSSDLLDIIGNVNGHVHASTERKTFVTMALGAFDPETRQFDHVRAGHNPIVWRRPAQGETSLLNAPGLGLGIVSDRLFRRSVRLDHLQLDAGDALVFYSDGVTEAMNAELEQFGEERLMRAVEDADGLDAGRTREHILNGVNAFLDGVPPQDDMTIVVLRVN